MPSPTKRSEGTALSRLPHFRSFLMHVLPLLLIGLLGAVPAAALTVSGRLTSSLYAYEVQDLDSSATTHLRGHQSLRLDLSRLAAPALSLHTYVRGTTDLADAADTDPRLRIYNAYLAWKKTNYRLHLGRQRIYAGVGSGAIDGGRADIEFRGLKLTAYAGTLVPLGRSTDISSWSAGHLWGARLSTERFFNIAAALSLALRARQPEAYDQPGTYSGVQATPAAVERRLLGLDLNRRFAGGHSLYGRLDYDLEDEILRRSAVSGRYVLSPRLSAQGEWFQRQPAIFANSIFSAFPSEKFQEIGARLYYRARPDLQLSLHFASLLYDGDSARRAGLTASLGQHYSVGYYHSGGYARASDGLVGSVHYPVGRKLLLRGELDLTAYERYEDADEREELATGSLGLTYRPDRKTFVEVEVQGLRNPVYANDARLLIRGSRRFFKGGK